MACPDPMPLVVQDAGPDTRVLLIQAPYPGRLKFDGQPSSLLTAAGPLVRELSRTGRLGEVGLLDPQSPSKEFYESLERLAAGGALRVACISTSTAAIEEAARIASVLRAAAGPELLIIAGGPHEDGTPIPMAERIPGVDLSISGDAEDALAAITSAYLNTNECRGVLLDGVPALLGGGLRGRGAIARRGTTRWTWRTTGNIPVEQVLCRPWSSRTVRFPVFGDTETLPIMLSRGCSYGRCTFCAEADGVGQRVVEDFVPLARLLEAHPRAAIYFQDSIFPTTRAVRQRLLPFLRDSARPWGCQVYLPTLSRGFARLLAEHGCVYVYTGVENGSEDLRAAVGKPRLQDALLRERLLWLAENDLRVGLSFMFGILDANGALRETKRSIKSTVDFAHECLANRVSVEAFYANVMTVLPGTHVAAGLARAGVDLDFYRMPRVPEFADLEDGEVGYSFASVPGFSAMRSDLTKSVREAAHHLATLGRLPPS